MTRKILSQQPAVSAASEAVQFESLLEVFLAPDFRILNKMTLADARTLIANNILFSKAGAPDDSDRLNGVTRLCLNTDTNVLYISIAGGAFIQGSYALRGANATFALIQDNLSSFVNQRIEAEAQLRAQADAALSTRIDNISVPDAGVPTFATGTAYGVDTLFVSDGTLYRVKTAITASNTMTVVQLLAADTIERIGGLFTDADALKLGGIESGAQVNRARRRN